MFRALYRVFTRPIQWSSVRSLFQKRRTEGPLSVPDFQATKMVRRKDDPESVWGRDAVDVSENPIDTLPAELREELERSHRGRLPE